MANSQSPEYLTRIEAPHFVAAVVLVHDGPGLKVARAAPILRYMLGWSGDRVYAYIERKGWRVANG